MHPHANPFCFSPTSIIYNIEDVNQNRLDKQRVDINLKDIPICYFVFRIFINIEQTYS